MIRVLNKVDRVNPEIRKGLIRRLDGIAVSALNRSTLKPLSEKMEAAVEHLYGNTA